MKCALFPFDKWLPAAYSNSTPTGSAMLSSIVSKGYIFLLIKVYVRVIGFDVIRSLGICDVLFIFGAIGMVAGSINATRAKTTRMMVAYSSVAQIGYIFAALGLGSELGVMCALWHTLAHSATSPCCLFPRIRWITHPAIRICARIFAARSTAARWRLPPLRWARSIWSAFRC